DRNLVRLRLGYRLGIVVVDVREHHWMSRSRGLGRGRRRLRRLRRGVAARRRKRQQSRRENRGAGDHKGSLSEPFPAGPGGPAERQNPARRHASSPPSKFVTCVKPPSRSTSAAAAPRSPIRLIVMTGFFFQPSISVSRPPRSLSGI